MRLRSRVVRLFFIFLVVLGILVSRTKYDDMGLALQDIGYSVYSYHKQTGRWPTQGDSILIEPAHSMIRNRVVVVVWHVNLRSDPKQNRDAILAYQAKGLRTWLGFTYVCRGDLRTEIITQWQLHNALSSRMEK